MRARFLFPDTWIFDLDDGDGINTIKNPAHRILFFRKKSLSEWSCWLSNCVGMILNSVAMRSTRRLERRFHRGRWRILVASPAGPPLVVMLLLALLRPGYGSSASSSPSSSSSRKWIRPAQSLARQFLLHDFTDNEVFDFLASRGNGRWPLTREVVAVNKLPTVSLSLDIPRGGGDGWIPSGWNPFGYKITRLGQEFLSYDGSLDSDIGRFLASLKSERKSFKTIKSQWLEVLRVSKTGQSMRIYKNLQELINFCLKAGLID